MNHNDVKKYIFDKKSGVAEEYNKLETLYEIKSQLIKIRSEKGLSQLELAEMVGTKQSAISRLESGDYNPSIEFLSKIANALGKELHVEIR